MATSKKKKVSSDKKNRVTFVLDQSGSMQSLARKTLALFNENVDTIRKQAEDTGMETSVSLVTFSNNVREEYFNASVETLKKLDYYPADGGTALFDAVGAAIERTKTLKDANDPNTSFLVMVLTDGEENQSHKYSAFSLNNLIREVQATDRYSLAFLVPPRAKRRFCQTFAVPEGNVREWEGTEQGVIGSTIANNASIGAYFNSRSLGQTSVKTFYTDLSSVKAVDVQQALDDISAEVKVWTVEKEEDIRTFCEGKSKKPLLKGAAFYALTKTELKIQEYKKLLVMENGKKEVYAGAGARQVLGLPTTGTIKVIPKNHSNFTIYVQSTSTNRKLVRGTKVVYWPSVGVAFTEGPSAPSASPKRK